MNFSAAQFHNTGILQTIVQALADAKVSPSRLEIEITESMLLSKYGSAASILNALLELGVTVALDDFGTGFSSLTYLRKLPFSRIKIDQSFIRDMLVQPDCAAIVKSVIGLARDLRIDVVAEGVETADQLEYLRQISCDEVQGYLISRPVSADAVLRLLDPKKLRATLRGVGTKASQRARPGLRRPSTPCADRHVRTWMPREDPHPRIGATSPRDGYARAIPPRSSLLCQTASARSNVSTVIVPSRARNAGADLPVALASDGR